MTRCWDLGSTEAVQNKGGARSEEVNFTGNNGRSWCSPSEAHVEISKQISQDTHIFVHTVFVGQKVAQISDPDFQHSLYRVVLRLFSFGFAISFVNKLPTHFLWRDSLWGKRPRGGFLLSTICLK